MISPNAILCNFCNTFTKCNLPFLLFLFNPGKLWHSWWRNCSTVTRKPKTSATFERNRKSWFHMMISSFVPVLTRLTENCLCFPFLSVCASSFPCGLYFCLFFLMVLFVFVPLLLMYHRYSILCLCDFYVLMSSYFCFYFLHIFIFNFVCLAIDYY